MKKILFPIFLLSALASAGQEQTIEVLDIFGIPDTVICEGDTIAGIYFQVIQTSTENGTDYPNTRIDTVLYQNGNCPADSLEVLRQVEVQAIEIQNRAANAMSNAFSRARRGQVAFQDVRTLYNNFTGSDIYLSLENRFWDTYEGVYRIIDVQDGGSSVLADMIRIGATNRYRLEVQAGEPGEGTRYTVLPLSRTRFQVNQWTPAGGIAENYILSQDRESDPARPVFREAGYVTGGAADRLRIVKVR